MNAFYTVKFYIHIISILPITMICCLATQILQNKKTFYSLLDKTPQLVDCLYFNNMFTIINKSQNIHIMDA